MIIELNKDERKELKAMLKGTDGLMFKRRGDILEIVFVCLSLEQSIKAHAEVKTALAQVRKNSNARFLAN